jgi:acetyl-CoA C-acetyltransferase
MKKLRKKIYTAAGYNTAYCGSGSKDFDPTKPMRSFEEYLKETAEGTSAQVAHPEFDEGVIGSFMSGRFLKQANLPAFLPFMVPSLKGKPCTGVEGACGTGGRAIATAALTILSDMADAVFVAGFEMQNKMKSVYGADVLAGAAYYNKERKGGQAHFFPGIFSERAGAYYEKFGYDPTRQAMAKWYEQAIHNARKNPKAQEYHNTHQNLFSLGMTSPNPKQFVPYLNPYDCSKVSDGASSLLILSEEGLKKCGIKKDNAIEIIAVGAAEDDITRYPEDLTKLSTTEIAVNKALEQAGLNIKDIGLIEIHDCFTITAILSLEAIGLAKKGEGGKLILEGYTTVKGHFPTNLSGGLVGFGHPTGATGIRQLVDLIHQMTNKANNQAVLHSPFGLMVSMGGNDKTVTSIITKAISD